MMSCPPRAESMGKELLEFIRLESSDPCRSSTALHRNAIEKLVESAMGTEITAYADRVIESSLDNVVCLLAESFSFQLLRGAVPNCSSAWSREGDSSIDRTAYKRSKNPRQTEAAPASFSLFDMLDQQKGGFAPAPRITASKVIEAHNQEKNTSDKHAHCKAALQLLEKADDIEDLSPDPESWEQIRQLLYRGLAYFSSCANIQCRFLRVHASLLDICQRDSGGSNNKIQRWDLAQNLVGSILSQSNDFLTRLDELKTDISTMKQYIDLYWDEIDQLLKSLHHLALDYVTSCVGDEIQIERMMLGICFILVNDTAACASAAMKPLAGWFEVWARFVPPKRLLTIVECCGLADVVLQRCHQLGSSDSVERLAVAINSCDDTASANLHDMQHALYVQSLSILRVILYQCGPLQLALARATHLFTESADSSNNDTLLSIFVTSDGVTCTENTEKLLDKKTSELRMESEQMKMADTTKSVDLLLKPFQDAFVSNELQEASHVKWLCTSSLELLENFKTQACK